MSRKSIYVIFCVLAIVSVSAQAELVHHWKLDEDTAAGATIAVDSVGGLNGTIQGAISVEGIFGNALSFDGSNDSVEFPNFVPPLQGTFTFWMNPASVGPRGRIFGGHDAFEAYVQNDILANQLFAAGSMPNYLESNATIPTDTWMHVALTYDGTSHRLQIYLNGSLDGENSMADDIWGGGAFAFAHRAGRNQEYYHGLLDDFRIYDHVLMQTEVEQVMKGISPALASNPKPDDGATDVPRDVSLSWTEGAFADKHDVYFGTNFNNVNDADRTNPLGVLVNQSQVPNSYSPAKVLQWEQTYYWRIDEVNAPPDSTIFKGDVCQFTVEPFAYPVAGENITATASSQFSADTGPENTINGSGLDDNDLHSTDETGIWLSNMTGPQPTWIQYELDRVYKLHQMWVWNHNTSVEPVIGFGFKEVTIEYSTNGIDWAVLADVPEFARAPGQNGYAHNTTVDLSGVVAKYVKLTANSNWGGMVPQYGLSEVRFFHIPVLAREPNPASGTTDMGVDNVTLSWRVGRKVATHNVYFSTDQQAVIDETISPVSVPAGSSYVSYDTGELVLGQSYYWKVNEVNEAETPATWQGDVWNFSTQEYLVVDDFEDYNDFEPDRIFDTWKDGWNVPENGSQVGSNTPPFAEQTIVHSGSQSMPLIYDNSTASYSEATANVANLPVGQDWTKYGIKTLSLWFYGDPTNAAGQMYVKLNGSKVTYDGDAGNLRRTAWQMWYIDLANFGVNPAPVAGVGVNLSNVTELSIGLERSGVAGGKGAVYFDDIRLYGVGALQPVITIGPIANLEADVDPGDPTMLLAARVINGIPVSELILGTTTTDFEKHAAHPAADADNFDLTTYASLDDSTVIQTVFDVPVTTIFMMERGANDSGFFQPIDMDGNPIGAPLAFTAADFQFEGTDTLKIVGQKAGGIAIVANVPINGLEITPPIDGPLEIDPAIIAAIPAPAE